jgi:uncharacterized protein
MNRIFLDTSYAIALSALTDQFHAQATQIADQLVASKSQIITTQAILLEIGNALSKQRYRRAAVVLLDSLANDSTVKIVPLSEALYNAAFRLFQERADKEWGLVDCVSCIVMQEYGITDALTSDEHFRQMGFCPLLRN